MNLISVPVALMAGVCAYVGGYYLLSTRGGAT
jgi:hypothetical protein